MSLFNLPVESNKPKKPVTKHPWEKTIKWMNENKILRAHNTVNNLVYPPPKEETLSKNAVTFTVMGNRTTKEFMYCVNLVQALHKYRPKYYAAPVVRDCSPIEWPQLLRSLQVTYGGLAYCFEKEVAILYNKQFLGGIKELKDLIGEKYSYRVVMNYEKDVANTFISYVKASGRPCAYMHISINKEPIGTLIFMLYSDVTPVTCENFLRLCQAKRGGYSGTPIHRIVKDGWIQGGGFSLKKVDMSCENFIVPHNRRGVLAMANAGRHVDCSTQFFVLLQPQEWLTSKFVAFGQLIDGEATLKKIENVETFYEAPTSEIIIYDAGVFVSDCQDITINKGAREYIDGHIENLYDIEQIFIWELWEHVVTEIKFREAMIEDLWQGVCFGVDTNEMENLRELDEMDYQPSYYDKNKNKDLAFGLATVEGREKIRGEIKAHIKRMHPSRVDDEENEEFDNYSYVPEEYSYSQISVKEEPPKPFKPYQIPLTDVPYPGEVNSNFDLKRLMQGDYCLESDLGKPQFTRKYKKSENEIEMINTISKIICSYGGIEFISNLDLEEEASTSSDSTMDSDDQKEMGHYLKETIEKMCFSGTIFRKMARTHCRPNPLLEKGPNEVYTDNELRMLRMAIRTVRSEKDRGIGIAVTPWSTPHIPVSRMPTGFIKGEPVYSDDEESPEEEKNEHDAKRKVSLVVTEDHVDKMVERKQTGWWPNQSDMLCRTGLSDVDVTSSKSVGSGKGVRIDDLINSQRASVRQSIRASRYFQDESHDRQSVLLRLYDDAAVDDKAPTLKDHKSLEEKLKMKYRGVLSDGDMPDSFMFNKNATSRMFQAHRSDDDIIDTQSYKPPKKQTRRSTAGETLDRKALRTLQGKSSKTRPIMTVDEYRRMNDKRRQ